jgi:drug/metabolite transporter (DMT)-like permease
MAWTLLLLASTVVWGATFTVVKQATTQIDVMWFLSLRFTVAALLMLPLANRKAMHKVGRAGIGIGAVLAVSYLLQTTGLQRVQATISGLITGLFVVVAPVLNRLFFRVPIRALHWFSVCASLWGLCWLTGATPQQFGEGEWLTLGCAITLGLHVCLLDKYSTENDPFALATVQIVVAAVIFLAALLFCETFQWTTWKTPSRSTWGAILLTAILATAVGYSVQTTVQKHLPAVRVAVILAMEPVFAALTGWLAGERLGVWQIAGGAIMLSAMLIAEFAPSRK